MKKFLFLRIGLVSILLAYSLCVHSQLTLDTPNTNSVLYLGEGNKQPLIVGFGGSEGGNAWASKGWKKIRDQFTDMGYAFLAIAYFGSESTPEKLDRIALEDINNAIKEATKNPKVDKKKIAIIGGSTGGGLALVIASYFRNIKCVIGIVPSHVVFPGHTEQLTTSCWTFRGKELPFVPVNEEALRQMAEGDYRAAFEAALSDSIAEHKALIKVEKIKGPILLISATEDDMWPSQPMSDKIVSRLHVNKFKYFCEHIPIEGGHTEPLKHFNLVYSFLEQHFPSGK